MLLLYPQSLSLNHKSMLLILVMVRHRLRYMCGVHGRLTLLIRLHAKMYDHHCLDLFSHYYTHCLSILNYQASACLFSHYQAYCLSILTLSGLLPVYSLTQAYFQSGLLPVYSHTIRLLPVYCHTRLAAIYSHTIRFHFFVHIYHLEHCH